MAEGMGDRREEGGGDDTTTSSSKYPTLLRGRVPLVGSFIGCWGKAADVIEGAGCSGQRLIWICKVISPG